VNPVHLAASLTVDGWLITGDLGRIDSDGYLFVTGRVKDLIIRGGHNIDPALIEEVLLRSPEVLHAAAIGKPDAHAGELPVAFVQLMPGSQANASGLIAFLAVNMAERAAIPKEIFIVDKIPFTDVGKPSKSALRRETAERTFRTALLEALNLRSEPDRVKVDVDSHTTHGTLVTIRVMNTPIADRSSVLALIEAIMDQYAFAYLVEWE
jgi:fatty-acyl-CoA synthase